MYTFIYTINGLLHDYTIPYVLDTVYILAYLEVVHFLLGCNTWYPDGWLLAPFQRWDS